MNSFSKENLKVLIVGSEPAYKYVKDLSAQLGIEVLFFDAEFVAGLLETKREAWRKDENAGDEVPTHKDVFPEVGDELFQKPEEVTVW